ncbi:hypothetical protein H5410_064345 [Solanum commersonii]|uniref:Uncharacterized protein n=1 Tax=Solanum commersonii TaxID=4109 RepID=A0A9J5VZR1_SOLCO|nr:hypothetical protein H5410_064345 [Solanum commersonii]
MQNVEQSIDDKSHKLFRIRDELASLSEQARMMQYEINQLNAEQADNISDFLLLCEHLDTCPKRNSNLKGNITPNKMAGDVPLAPNAINISTVGKQHLKKNILHSQDISIISQKKSGETYEVLGTTNLILRISIFPNGSPGFTAQLFKFGYLDQHFNEKQGLANFKVLDHDHDWVLMTKGKFKSKTLKEKILDIEPHRMEASEETWKLVCKFLDHKHSVNEAE